MRNRFRFNWRAALLATTLLTPVGLLVSCASDSNRAAVQELAARSAVQYGTIKLLERGTLDAQAVYDGALRVQAYLETGASAPVTAADDLAAVLLDRKLSAADRLLILGLVDVVRLHLTAAPTPDLPQLETAQKVLGWVADAAVLHDPTVVDE